MSDHPETPEALPPELERLVSRMRADVLDDAETQALGARVVAAVALPPPPSVSAPTPEAASQVTAGALTTGAGALVASAVAVLALGSGAAWFWADSPGVSGGLGASSLDDSSISVDAGARDDAWGAQPEAPAPEGAPRGVAAEHVLLERARRLASSDPAAALALAEEHARSAPDGVLAPEREVVAIEALRALGRDDEARERGAAFLARWPGSPYRERLSVGRE